MVAHVAGRGCVGDHGERVPGVGGPWGRESGMEIAGERMSRERGGYGGGAGK